MIMYCHEIEDQLSVCATFGGNVFNGPKLLWRLKLTSSVVNAMKVVPSVGLFSDLDNGATWRRKESLSLFVSGNGKQPTIREDLWHDLTLTVKVLPVSLGVLPSLLGNFWIRGLLLKSEDDWKWLHFWLFQLMLVHYLAANGLFYGAFVGKVRVGFSLVLYYLAAVGPFSLGLFSIDSWSALSAQFLETICFAIGTFVWVLWFMNIGNKSFFFVVSCAIGGFIVAIVNVSVFVWYFCVAQLLKEGNWLLELFVSGFVYPLIIAFAGRVLIVDMVSFIIRSLMKSDQLETFNFWVRVTKLNFHLSAQVVMFLLDSNYSFFVALCLNVVFESISLYINAKIFVDDGFGRLRKWLLMSKVEDEQHHIQKDSTVKTPSGRGFIQEWIEDGNSRDRKQMFACFYFNEMLTEKIGITITVAVSIGFSILNQRRQGISTSMQDDLQSFLDFAPRAAILFLMEIYEDILKKRVLWNATQISVANIQPKLTIYDVLVFSEVVGCGVAFIFLGDFLYMTYFSAG